MNANLQFYFQLMLSILLLGLRILQASDKPMTPQEKEDWARMEAMVQKEIDKMKAKYRYGSDTCQDTQTMHTQMLTPTPEGQDFEDVFRQQMCQECKKMAEKLEKGMVSADKRKRYGRHLSDEEIVELAYKLCKKIDKEYSSLCKETVERSEPKFYERYLEGPIYGLAEKVCEYQCNSKKEDKPKDDL